VKKNKKRPQPSGPQEALPVRPLFLLAAVAFIAGLGILAYANVLQGGFVWDDEVLVAKNAYIRDFSHLGNIFSENILGGVKRMSAFYRPLQVLSYAFDFRIWQLNPFGYHLTNALLHVGAAAAAYFFLLALGLPRRAALWAGFFFVVHPVHTESVSYVSGRADPLVAVFIFLCLTLYIRSGSQQGLGRYLLLMVVAGAALLSKEIALLLPLMALLYHYVFKTKVRQAGLWSLLTVTACYLILRQAFSRHLAGEMDVTVPFLQRIPGVFVAYTQYLRLLLRPVGLHMEYGQPRFSLAEPRALIGIVLLAGTVVLFFKARRKDPLLAFACGWFLLTLAPVANVFPVNAYMAEHWLYLPSVGVFLAAGLLLDRLARKSERTRRCVYGLVGGFVAFFAIQTVGQNRVWTQPALLYESILSHAPQSPRLLNNLANIYAAEPARQEEALALYKRAIASDPKMAFSYFNLANLYRRMGQEGLAVENYRKAMELNPLYVEAYSNLGVLYFAQGRFEEAAAVLEEGARLNLVFPDIHHNLGNTYQRLGRLEEALAAYKKAVELNPNFGPSHLNLAIAYFKKGDYRQAVEHADRAQALGEAVPQEILTALGPYRR